MMVDMMRRPVALVVVVCGLSLAGCCGDFRNCHNVPVDCEDLCNCLHYTNCECAHNYPYSCPPCPYFDSQRCLWRRPYFCPPAQQVEVVTPATATNAPTANGTWEQADGEL